MGTKTTKPIMFEKMPVPEMGLESEIRNLQINITEHWIRFKRRTYHEVKGIKHMINSTLIGHSRVPRLS